MADRNKSFIVIIALVLAAGVSAIGYSVSRKAKAPATTTTVDPNAPALKAQGYLMGSDSAPVEIVMFADFECPGCAQFWRVTEPDVRTRLVASGKARFRFMDTPIPSRHPSSLTAHNAAACANAQGKFWEMHDKIYEGQLEWSAAANGKDMNAPKVMKGYATALSLDIAAFDKCTAEKPFEAQIMANRAEAGRVKVQSTPSFLIGKRLVETVPYDVIKALVDSATAEVRKAVER